MPRATTAAWLVMPPVLVRIPSDDVHAADVGRLGLAANQDDLLAVGDALLGLFGGEGDLADGRAGRGRQARGVSTFLSALGSKVGCSS